MKTQKALFNIGLDMMIVGVFGSIGGAVFNLIDVSTYFLAIFLVGFGCVIFNASAVNDENNKGE